MTKYFIFEKIIIKWKENNFWNLKRRYRLIWILDYVENESNNVTSSNVQIIDDPYFIWQNSSVTSNPYFCDACGRSANSEWLNKHYESPFIVNWATYFHLFAFYIYKVSRVCNFRIYLAPIYKATCCSC